MWATSQSLGWILSCSDVWKMLFNGSQISSASSFSICGCILSGSGPDLLDLSVLSFFLVSCYNLVNFNLHLCAHAYYHLLFIFAAFFKAAWYFWTCLGCSDGENYWLGSVWVTDAHYLRLRVTSASSKDKSRTSTFMQMPQTTGAPGIQAEVVHNLWSNSM